MSVTSPPTDRDGPGEPVTRPFPARSTAAIGARAADLEALLMVQIAYSLACDRARAHAASPTGVPPAADPSMDRTGHAVRCLIGALRRVRAVYGENEHFRGSREAAAEARMREALDRLVPRSAIQFAGSEPGSTRLKKPQIKSRGERRQIKSARRNPPCKEGRRKSQINSRTRKAQNNSPKEKSQIKSAA